VKSRSAPESFLTLTYVPLRERRPSWGAHFLNWTSIGKRHRPKTQVRCLGLPLGLQLARFRLCRTKLFLNTFGMCVLSLTAKR
jgi:hypothetical protein